MALFGFLTSTLGLTHLLPLANDTDIFLTSGDLGDSPDPTRLRTDQYGTQWDMSGDPVCEGVANSLLAFGVNTDFSSKVYAGEIDSRQDLNASNNNNLSDANDSSSYNWSTNRRTMMCWFRQTVELGGIPTAVLGHGGGTNNQIISAGLGGKIVFQSADAGQPYLAISSKDDLIVGKEYLVHGVWEHHSQHAGAGNRIRLYTNGVHQGDFELTGTDAMAAATGQPFVGNAALNYQSYGGGSIGYLRREKEVNLVGFLNLNEMTEADMREMFERSVLAQVTIEADTVANQQAALDALTGNDYSDASCAIRIVQATDAADYRLFIDNIQFKDNPNVRDIAVQYVGPNTLTIENTNGSNAVEVSTPPEVDRTTGILPGGGSIALVEDTVRIHAAGDVADVMAAKIVLEQAGGYVFTGVSVDEIENVSGGLVNIVTDGGAAVITDTGTGSETSLNAVTVITGAEGEQFNIYAERVDDGSSLGFDEAVTSKSYTVPVGVSIAFAMWSLGKKVYFGSISPTTSPEVVVPFTPESAVNSALDVSALVADIDVTLTPTEYSVTFDAPMDLNIEQTKAVLHQLSGRPASLMESLLTGNGTPSITIQDDDVAINSSIVKARRGDSLGVSDEVLLRAFFNTSEAIAQDGNYGLTPPDSDNIRVQTLLEKPALDPAQLAIAVWANSSGQAAIGHARAANMQTQIDE